MVRLCKDSDILRYEPVLFGELYPGNQIVAEGNGGELSGTTFESSTADFESAGIGQGDCIKLRSADGILDGIFEIVSVDSGTQLCISVLRSNPDIDPIAPAVSGPVADIYYRVSTWGPQIEEVSIGLTEYLGIKPGQADSEYSADDILDTETMRQICAYGVIAAIYSTFTDGQYKEKKTYYEKLFHNAREGCRIALDLNGTGQTSEVRYGGCGRLIRE